MDVVSDLHYRAVADEQMGRRIVRAAARYQLWTAPAAKVVWAAALVVIVAVTVLEHSGGADGAVIGSAIAVVAVVGLRIAGARRLGLAIRDRGYRPGTTVATDFGYRGFSVTNASGTSTHDYPAVQSVHALRDATVVRLHGRVSLFVVLPNELVPAEARARLAAPAPPGRS